MNPTYYPENIRQAAIAAIESGKASFYTATAGIPELKQAILAYMKEFYGADYDSNQVIVTDGAKFALYTLFQALLDEEDEVLIPVPYCQLCGTSPFSARDTCVC